MTDMNELDQTITQLSALAQDTRLRVFRYLMSAGEDGVPAGRIAEAMALAPNKLSGHLNILTQAGLLSVRRDGRWMIYSANVDAVSGLVRSLVETCCNNNPQVCAALADFNNEACAC